MQTGKVNLVSSENWLWQRIGSIVMLQGTMTMSLLPGAGSGGVNVSLPFPIAGGLSALATNNQTPFNSGSAGSVQVTSSPPNTLLFDLNFSGLYVNAQVVCVATYEAV